MNLLEEFKSLTDSDKQEFVKMIIEEMKKTDCFKQSVNELTEDFISLKIIRKETF